MTPTTPRESRKASSSSPITMIFSGGPSASGNSSESRIGSQKRRSNSPIPVPAPLSVRNLFSSARSMAVLRGFILLLTKLGAGGAGRQRVSAAPSHRPLALHRHARAGAGVRPVVPQRAVLGAAIVPERNRILGPAEAALEQRIFHVLVEISEDRAALVARDADDVADGDSGRTWPPSLAPQLGAQLPAPAARLG